MEKIKEKVFIVIFVLWILLGIGVVAYNAVKTIPEVRTWAFLSDTQKRELLFGDRYAFAQFVKTHTSETTHILFATQDEMVYYLSRYYLYPRLLSFNSLKNINANQYVVTYNSQWKHDQYVKVASFSSKTSTDYGAIYKKK